MLKWVGALQGLIVAILLKLDLGFDIQNYAFIIQLAF